MEAARPVRRTGRGTDRLKGRNRASVRSDHTSVALAIAVGAHPKAIQSRMGHSSINVTSRTNGTQ